VTVSADSATLVSSGDDGAVRVWDTRTGDCLAVLEGHTAAVYGVALSDDMQMIASASFDGTVRLWKALTGECLAVLDGHSDAVYDVVISVDGRTVASGSLDGTVKLWDTTSHALLQTLRPDRRYERMDITGLTGVTEAQRATLLALGAVETPGSRAFVPDAS
jgi:WD40 repeat protein